MNRSRHLSASPWHPAGPARRALAALLALLLALPATHPAFAQRKSATDDGLADEPIGAKIAAAPNVMFTLDNSGSMAWDFLPDQIVGPSGTFSAILNGGSYCRDASGAMASACGYVASGSNYRMAMQTAIPVGDTVAIARYMLWAPAARVPAFNGMAYNPAVEYKAPLKATFDPTVHNAEVPNTSYAYPEMNATNTSTWTSVPQDGFGKLWTSTVKVNLNNTSAAGRVAVGRWCNTDWPLDVTSGNECRVNGQAYLLSGSVPAAAADWNYPVRPTGFSATTSKPDVRFFHYQDYALWCKTATTWTAANLTDANGTGTNCRHNNKAYTATPAVSALPNNYPDATYKNQVLQTATIYCTSYYPTVADWWADASGAQTQCKTASTSTGGFTKAIAPATYGTIPPKVDAAWHYWRGNVEWCKTAVAAAASGSTTKWQGFGAYAAGNCQGFPDTMYKYPRFYKYMQVSGYDNDANQALERVDLDFNNQVDHDASYVTTIVDSTGATLTQTVTLKRPFAIDTYNAAGELVKRSEMTNFANWFAYYRHRVFAAKTVATRAFGNLDGKYRVGFGVFTNSSGTAMTTNTQDIKDFTPGGPDRTNWYFNVTEIIPANGTPTFAAMARVGEYFAGASSPIQYSCQKNWHILFTDGYANDTTGITGPTASTSINVDYDPMPATWPAPSSGLTADLANVRDPSLTPGGAWPKKYREGLTDSRKPTLADIALYYWKTDLKTSGTTAANNVPISTVPPDSNLAEYAISVADPASWQHVNFAAISFGARGTLDVSDQKATLMKLSDKNNTAVKWPAWVSNGPQAVDDLWHAAINGRGRFVNAANPDQLAGGLARILNDVAKAQGARVGVGFVSTTLTATSYVYKASFDQGWAGVVKKVQVDPATGNETGTVAWTAADQLATLLTPTVADTTPWLSSKPATARKIVTTSDATGKGVPFRLDKISATQQLTLGGDATRQQLVLEYLRGSSANESEEILGRFRVRASRLGDVVNSQAVYVGASPSKPFLDTNDPGYSTFKATTRAARVYVGANDGMLHAFDDATGREVWAYLPRNLLRSGATGIAALAYQEGGVPMFHHRYYVDSTPRVADVYLDGAWKTILVGGLGKGGNAYYAIDITKPGDPTTETETDIAGKVMWEFTDADLGYTYGSPIIAKTYAYGWVMIVPSGYDNATGKGKVFVVDLKTGTKLQTFTTNVGSATSPSGLAFIAGYTKDHRNQYVEQVYGGDLQGNLWRFDLSDPDASKWPLDMTVPLAQFTLSGKAQPITTPPQIEVDIANGVDRWVFVGTGRLLEASDLDVTDAQTFYALRDGNATTPKTIAGAVTRSSTGMVAVTSKDPLASVPATGWYDDLPSGQRIVTPPQAEASIVAYSATRPQTDVCATNPPATLYAREYSKGGSRLQSGGGFVESIDIDAGAAGIELIALLVPGASGSAMPTIRLSVTQLKDGTIRTVDISLPPLVSKHRMTWRVMRD